MAKEAISEILASEAKAGEILNRARKEAAELTDESEMEIRLQVQSILDQTKEKITKSQAELKDKAQEAASVKIKEAESKAAEMRSIPASVLDKLAEDLLKEVIDYGNR